MTWVQVLMFLWILAPSSAVYVTGHSRAADKARANLANLTCYTATAERESSSETLQVDRIFNPSSRRSWVVLVMTDSHQRVVYEKKAEENPWPLPSTMDRLLRNLAKSTCPQFPSAQKSAAEARGRSTTGSQVSGDVLVKAASH